MSSQYSFKDIQKLTGLKMDFIRKVYNANQDIFRPHMTRGDNNSILFTSSGYTLFDKIKQEKESGANLPAISSYLRQIGGQSTQSTTQTPQNQMPKPAEETVTEQLLKRVDAVYSLAIKAKEETIETQKQQINDLRSSLLLLTDGRSPEEIKRQREEQAAAIAETRREAERVSRELEQERHAKEMAERERREVQQALAVEQKRAERANQRAEIAAEMAQVLQEKGRLPFYAAGKRKALDQRYRELQEKYTGILSESET